MGVGGGWVYDIIYIMTSDNIVDHQFKNLSAFTSYTELETVQI